MLHEHANSIVTENSLREWVTGSNGENFLIKEIAILET